MAVTVPHYTIEDLERMPDDGNRYELLDGILLVTPAPALVHQLLATRIVGFLLRAPRAIETMHVVGPGAVVSPPGTQLEPDVLVFPTRFGPMSSWVEVSEHWLAVEVLSRSSRVYDREFKRDAYLALGVRAVWLVDWRERTVEVTREKGSSVVVRDELRWESPSHEVLVTIPLSELFAGVE